MADVKRMADLYKLLGSIKGVAREMGISRNTVKKYLLQIRKVQEGTAEEIIPMERMIIQPRRVLTDTVVQKIHQRLESNLEHPRKQRLNAKRIWELLVKEGHKIGYTTVKDEVARWKRTNSPREVYILQEPRKGQRAEFDWGEVNLCINGIWSKFYLAMFVLPFSLYRFARLYSRSTHLEIIQAHIEFFQETGAVPETIFYDRMAVVYDSKKQQLNEEFLNFSTCYDFCPCLCNPASPHEKGTDEESIGYVRRSTFGERSSFQSFEQAAEWLSLRLAEINSNPVYRRPEVPVQGLVQERAMMKPLPALEYENCDLKGAAISRYSLVKCDGNYYSVPDTYRPRQITLRVFFDRIELLDGDSIIASHRRLTGKGQYSLDITHFIKTFCRKPGALPNARALDQADEQIKNLFNKYYLDDPKEFLPILDLMRETSPGALSEALTILNQQNIPPTYDMLRFFLHQTAEQKAPQFNFSGGFDVTEPDLEAFDKMMECKPWT